MSVLAKKERCSILAHVMSFAAAQLHFYLEPTAGAPQDGEPSFALKLYGSSLSREMSLVRVPRVPVTLAQVRLTMCAAAGSVVDAGAP